MTRAACVGTKRIAEWFKGRAQAGQQSLGLSSKGGYRLEVRVGGGRASGSVVFPGGERHAFSAASVKRSAGLYRIEIVDGGRSYLGGWIVL